MEIAWIKFVAIKKWGSACAAALPSNRLLRAAPFRFQQRLVLRVAAPRDHLLRRCAELRGMMRQMSEMPLRPEMRDIKPTERIRLLSNRPFLSSGKSNREKCCQTYVNRYPKHTRSTNRWISKVSHLNCCQIVRGNANESPGQIG